MSARFDRPTAVICMVAALNSMGLGLILPVLPELLAEFGGGSLTQAAALGGALSLVFAVMQFLFSPLLGALSDRFGRRPVLLGSLALSSVDYLIMAFAPSLWLLFLGRVLSGVSSSTFSVASAYLADRSSGDDRAGSFGVLGAAAGIGFVLGPFVGGALGAYGPRAPFFVAAVLSVLTFVVAQAVLPETLAASKRRRVSLREANPLGFLMTRRPGASPLLLGAFFLDAVAGFAIPAVWAYFGAARFGWDAAMIGLSFGIMGIGYAIVQAMLVGLFTRRLGNLGAAGASLLAGAFGFVSLVWIVDEYLALLLLPVFAIHSIARTGITAHVSLGASEDVQGQLQGMLASLSALASIIAYPLMSQAFAYGASHAGAESIFAGLPFVIAAAATLTALVCVTWAQLGDMGRGQRHAHAS